MPIAMINALSFLINTIADLYVFILIMRAILFWARANRFNPLIQFIAKLSNKPVLTIKRVIPDVKNIELSNLLLIMGVELIKFLLLGLLTWTFPHFFGLVILIIAEILKLTVNVFFYAILLQVILSWLPHQSYNEIYYLLANITAPIMRPVRRMVPPIGHFDISPIPALIGLQFIVILLLDPLYALGMHLAFQ